MKNKTYIIFAVALILVGAGAFFGGMKYQETKGGTRFAAAGNRQFQGAGNRAGGANLPSRTSNNGGLVMGEIISQDDKSITVKLQDGSSKIVLLPDGVTVNKSDTGSRNDLTTGAKVGIFGTTNSDGSVTATNVQLNPMFRMGQPGGGQPQPTSSPSN